MECNNCQVNELKIEFKVEGDTNIPLLAGVLEHLKRRDILVDAKGNTFIVKESDVRDFIDFSHDHMDASQITYRISKQPWEPMEKIDEVLFSELDVKKKRIALRKLKRKGLDSKYIKIFINLLEYIEKI